MKSVFSMHYKLITPILIGMLIFIPLGFMSYSLIYKEIRQENQIEIAKNNQVAKHVARYMNEYLYGYKSALQNLAVTASIVNEDADKVKRMMRDFDLTRPEPSLFWVVDSEGEFVAKSPDIYVNRNIRGLTFYEETMKGRSYIGGPFKSTITGQDIIVICEPYFRNERVAGVVGVSIPLSELRNKLDAIQVGDIEYVTMLNLQGEVLSNLELQEFSNDSSFEDSPLNQAVNVKMLNNGYYELNGGEDERAIHSFVRLDQAPWVVLAVNPLKEFEIKLRQDLGGNLIALLFFGMFAGFLIHYILLMRDMKNAEKIKQSEKLAVVGELAAGVAHEIRNPLTSIKGFVQLIDLKKCSNVPDFYIDTILDELDRIEQIVGDMVVLAKPALLEKETVDLAVLLQDTVNLMSLQTGMIKTNLRLDIEPGLPLIQGVRNQLKQVLINLIKNALEALDEVDQGEIQVTATYQADYVFISVADNGKGMESEQIRKLGTPFFSTKVTGTGLGLMISYGIIDNHSGEIMVESKIDFGTKFTIKLPVISSVNPIEVNPIEIKIEYPGLKDNL